MYVFLSPQATRGVDDDSVKVQKNYNNSPQSHFNQRQ